MVVVFVTYSLPDPVPLEKDSDGHPVRISIPEPVRGNDYLTVSCTQVYIITVCSMPYVHTVHSFIKMYTCKYIHTILHTNMQL